MNHARSFAFAVIALFVLELIAYAVNLGMTGAFGLPSGALTILALVNPPLTYAIAYVYHGIMTGDWTPPFPGIPSGADHAP